MGHWGYPNKTETKRKLKNGSTQVRTVIRVPYHVGSPDLPPDYSAATIEFWETVEDFTATVPAQQ